jgi:hypothetical protein
MTSLATHLEDHYGIDVERITKIESVHRVERRDGPSWVAWVFPVSRPLETVNGDAAILRFLEEQQFPADDRREVRAAPRRARSHRPARGPSRPTGRARGGGHVSHRSACCCRRPRPIFGSSTRSSRVTAHICASSQRSSPGSPGAVRAFGLILDRWTSVHFSHSLRTTVQGLAGRREIADAIATRARAAFS